MTSKILDSKVRRVALHGLGSLIEAKDGDEYVARFTDIISLFNSKYLPPGMSEDRKSVV